MDKVERLSAARRSGRVSRYHCWHLLRPEGVAEHTFNMINLILILTDGRASRPLILAALTHDMGEYKVGDIPSPTKRAMDELSRNAIEMAEETAMRVIHPTLDINLTLEEQELLAFADRFDALMKCIDEILMGNTLLLPVANNYYHYILKDHPLMVDRYEVADVLKLFTELRERINV